MQIWGHRGSRLPGPENAPTAVRAALAAGAAGCEIDVRRSADGALVSAHDAVVAGLTVVESSAQELQAAGCAALRDIVDAAAGGSSLVLEVKNIPGEPDFTRDATTSRLLVAALPGLLAQVEQPPRVLVSSFDATSLDVARDGGWPTGLLTLPGVAIAEGLAHARDSGYREVHVHVSRMGDAAPVHEAGLGLVAWTVTTLTEARAARDFGLDAIICDNPARVVAGLRGG